MGRLFDRILWRGDHVCPWWLCWSFDNPLRRLIQDPLKILQPLVKEGFTAIDVGPGMGYFTNTLLHLVGNEGRVIALDLQREMLDGLRRRAEKAGLSGKLETLVGTAEDLDPDVIADFVLVFWMIHEVPDQDSFLSALIARLRPGGLMLIAEPFLHVSRRKFEATVNTAQGLGLKLLDRPRVGFSYAALFSRG